MITNQEIAKIFYTIADILEMKNVPFKPRAYQKVAMALESLGEEVGEIYKKGGRKALRKIPGVGESIADHIEELIKTGRLKEYRRLKKQFPVDVESITAIEGVGPKIIKVLYQKLKIRNIKDLEKAAKAGKLRNLPRFGEKMEQKILRGIEFLRQSKGRFLLGYILPIVERMENALRKVPGVDQVETAGSIRRMQETVGDIDILVTAKYPPKVMDAFVSLPEVKAILAKGPTKSSVRLKIGIDADVRVLKPEEYGSALQYFTGDKNHNIHLRTIAIKKGYKLSEYGLFRGKKRVAGKTEGEIYKKLGMALMEPELRTDSGEIEAAQKGKLPKIIPYGSILGDLQVTTNWTDGDASISEMAETAMKLGLKYIAITDHTKSLAMTGGLNEKKLEKQGREIDKLNAKFRTRGFRILKSAEINILKDGSLDIKNEALKKLDVVSVAVHSNFKMTRKQMTERIIKAMQNPYVNILFHPTGRLIGQRPPYEVDMDAVILAAKKSGVALEINAFPERLDLNDVHARKAVEAGVKLTIDTDAHAPHHLAYLNLGVAQARRGWAKKSDVLNTLPVKKFLEAIRKLKKRQ
jgi:DNA polymerase (family 10)